MSYFSQVARGGTCHVCMPGVYAGASYVLRMYAAGVYVSASSLARSRGRTVVRRTFPTVWPLVAPTRSLTFRGLRGGPIGWEARGLALASMRASRVLAGWGPCRAWFTGPGSPVVPVAVYVLC